MSLESTAVKSVMTLEDAKVIDRLIGLGDAVAYLCFRAEDVALADRTSALEALGVTIAELSRGLAERMIRADALRSDT